MENQNALDEFGKLLISEVRDKVLKTNDLALIGKMGSKESLEIYRKIKSFNEQQVEFLKLFTRDIVDSTLHYFLWMVEQHNEVKLTYQINEKTAPENLATFSDGLCGELHTDEGWIKKYSKYPPSID